MLGVHLHRTTWGKQLQEERQDYPEKTKNARQRLLSDVLQRIKTAVNDLFTAAWYAVRDSNP